jgi:hypothetical protein
VALKKLRWGVLKVSYYSWKIFYRNFIVSFIVHREKNLLFSWKVLQSDNKIYWIVKLNLLPTIVYRFVNIILLTKNIGIIQWYWFLLLVFTVVWKKMIRIFSLLSSWCTFVYLFSRNRNVLKSKMFFQPFCQSFIGRK